MNTFHKGSGTTIGIGVVALVVIIAVLFFVRMPKKDTMPTSDTPNASEQSSGELTSGAYTVDVSKSSIVWLGKKALINTEHQGTFSLENGSFMVADNMLTEGSFTIDMTSLTDDGSGVGAHLKSDAFFDVATHPTATFVLTGFADGMVTGDLTLVESTQSIAFPLAMTMNEGMLSAHASFMLDRTKWGITFGSGSFFDNLGDAVIEDMVGITLDIVAYKAE